nr:MAG TPA: hypothetical protein [Caudoviricetes sp.]
MRYIFFEKAENIISILCFLNNEFYVLSSSTDTRDDYSVGFLIDNSLIGYMIFNMGWVHVRYEVDTTGVRTYIKYGSNEWWRFS